MLCANEFVPDKYCNRDLQSHSRDHLPVAQRVDDFLNHSRIVDGGGHGIFLAVYNIAQGLAQCFAGTCLGQTGKNDRVLVAGDGTDVVAHTGQQLLVQFSL